MKKYVLKFAEGDGTMKNLLGGKGAGLAEMVRLGLPVPLGFIVTTEACTLFNTSGKVLSDEVKKQIGITDTLIRISVGLEDADDLVADLGQALG